MLPEAQAANKNARPLGGRASICWWSWGDSNPRPQAFFAQFYMFSDLIWISPPVSRSRTLHRPPAPYFLAPTQGTRIGASPCNYPCSREVRIAPDPLAQPIGQLLQGSLAIKQRVRNVRRLQLVCLNLFYERIQLDMPRCDSEPTSKPVQPQAHHFRPG